MSSSVPEGPSASTVSDIVGANFNSTLLSLYLAGKYLKSYNTGCNDILYCGRRLFRAIFCYNYELLCVYSRREDKFSACSDI